MSHVDGQPRLFQKDSLKYDPDNDFVGSGTFGEVFRCHLADTGQQVAVKVLTTPKRLKPREVDIFMNEVGILHRLTSCPHVIRFLGLCTTPGHYAIVMEFIEHGDLEEMLLYGEDKHPIVKQWDCRISLALQIAQGMNFLHSLQPPIIHRDLKTANVLVDSKYRSKIIDFGLSKTRGLSIQSTRSHTLTGTLAFVAPEVFKREVVSDKEKKTDVYSYSIVLWQLKERKIPYDDPAEVLRTNVLAGMRPKLSNDDDCSEGFQDLIVRCWDSLPDIRLSFREIITMFEGIRLRPSNTHAQASDDGQTQHTDPVIRPDDTVRSSAASLSMTSQITVGGSSASALSQVPQVVVDQPLAPLYSQESQAAVGGSSAPTLPQASQRAVRQASTHSQAPEVTFGQWSAPAVSRAHQVAVGGSSTATFPQEPHVVIGRSSAPTVSQEPQVVGRSAAPTLSQESQVVVGQSSAPTPIPEPQVVGRSSAPILSQEPQITAKPVLTSTSSLLKPASSQLHTTSGPVVDPPFNSAATSLSFDITGMSVTSVIPSMIPPETHEPSPSLQSVAPPHLPDPLPSSSSPFPTRMTYGMTGFLDPLPVNPIVPVDVSVDVQGHSAYSGIHLGPKDTFTSSVGMTSLRSDKKPGEHGQVQSVPNQWIRLGDLPERRHFLNSVATAEGKIVVANLFEFYLSDVQSGCKSWSVHKTLPKDDVKVHSLFTAHGRCFATYFHSNMSDWTQSVACYDFGRNSWQHVCDLPSHYHLQYYSAVAAGDNVYLVGGGDGAGTAVLDTVLIYDLESGRSCGSSTLKNKRRSCSTAIIDNVLYVVGGWDGQNHFNLVDAISLSDFSSLTVPPTPAYNSSSTVVSGRLVVTGGRTGPLSHSKISSSASILDMSSRAWLELPTMNDGRLCHGMCAATDGVIVAVGGNCDGMFASLKSVEALNVQL